MFFRFHLVNGLLWRGWYLIACCYQHDTSAWITGTKTLARPPSWTENVVVMYQSPPVVINGDRLIVPSDTSVATTSTTPDADYDTIDILPLIAARAGLCLLQSDLHRDAIGTTGSGWTDGTDSSTNGGKIPAGATNWIDDATAYALQQAMNQLRLVMPTERTGLDRDALVTWLRWIKNTPVPAVLSLDTDFQSLVNETIPDHALERLEQPRTEFLGRIRCRIIVLPSGVSLPTPLTEPPASLVYGKLLLGGVTRSRWLASSNSRGIRPPRRVGERTEILTQQSTNPNPVWIQYGGPSRMYEAVDIGPAAVLEVALLPRLKQQNSSTMTKPGTMTIQGMGRDMMGMFTYNVLSDGACKIGDPSRATDTHDDNPVWLSGKERNDAFQREFQSRIGGLKPQIDAIVRRVLDGRVIQSASESMGSNSKAIDTLTATKLEAEELALLGLQPVRGLLLYGPPGCGKTALAREISRLLRARNPKIVAAPELLDRWVGGSEKLVRFLFMDAEAELAACNGDATKSALHVIIIDEIDAVFRKRSNSEESGEATRSSVVNQILAKLDGVNAIPNVLLIGMTNRRDLLDDALLRPGRLEVQIEIPLPGKEGRREILNIHFGALRRKGRLSESLCCALDGQPFGVSIKSSKRIIKEETSESHPDGKVGTLPSLVRRFRDRFHSLRCYDLAANYATGGVSGADIAGLVRCSGSIALARTRKNSNSIDELLITLEDAKAALIEIRGKSFA